MKTDNQLINEIWKDIPEEEKKEQGEINKFNLIAKLARGKTLDVGYSHKPNPFLTNVIGVDIEKPLKPANYDKIIVADLEQDRLPFKANSFDTVIAADFLEHVQNVGNIMKEIHRVLKPKGRLIVSIPNPYNPTIMFMELFKLYQIGDNAKQPGIGHVHTFLESDFKTLLFKHKIKVDKIYGTYIQIPFTRKQISFNNLPNLTFLKLYVCTKR
jgi:SAM-dependent methyltransferase